jgi:RNA polymerase sigma factor (sigma-70 family)
VAALPDDPSQPLSRDPSEVALRAFVRARRRTDRDGMKEAWRALLALEWSRFQALVKSKRHPNLPNGRVPPEEVDAVVQEAIIRLHDWLKLEGDSIGEVRAIIRQAVHYAVLDHLDQHVRDDQHRAGSFDEEDPTGEGPAVFVRQVEDELAERLNDPLEDREKARAVGAAIEDLPETHRRVLVMRLSGWKAKEVAAETGLQPANVDQIFSRAIRQLQKALQDLR